MLCLQSTQLYSCFTKQELILQFILLKIKRKEKNRHFHMLWKIILPDPRFFWLEQHSGSHRTVLTKTFTFFNTGTFHICFSLPRWYSGIIRNSTIYKLTQNYLWGKTAVSLFTLKKSVLHVWCVFKIQLQYEIDNTMTSIPKLTKTVFCTKRLK